MNVVWLGGMNPLFFRELSLFSEFELFWELRKIYNIHEFCIPQSLLRA